MKVKVLYFARLREAIGRDGEELELPSGVADVAALREWLAARGEPWASAFGEIRRIRTAVDQTMATDDAALREGAEVAFFPPVTGG
ncbi:MAG: molybdopterin converting factor subunit 1 [Burkholderiaceae bacterium]